MNKLLKKINLSRCVNLAIVIVFFFVIFFMDIAGGLKQSTRDLSVQIAYSVIMAVSLNIVVGLLGELSLGHAGFMCIGAYIGGLIGNSLWSIAPTPLLALLAAILGGGIAAAIAGVLIGIPTLRLKGDYLAITTLAFGEIVRTIFKNQEIFGKAIGLSTNYYGKSLYIIAFATVIITVLIAQNLQYSRHGRAIQAIRDNEISARAMGVDVTYHKLTAFVLAAFFAGVAGALYAHNISPVRDTAFKFDKSIEILVMVVLGGMGNITGSILAAAALTFINVKLDVLLSGDLASVKKIIYAVILILIVIWNNAPALRKYREKISLKKLWIKICSLFGRKPANENDARNIADWDKIPTKIPMDSILSTDISVQDSSVPDDPERKPEAK